MNKLDAREMTLFALSCKVNLPVGWLRYLIFAARRQQPNADNTDRVFYNALLLIAHHDLLVNPAAVAKKRMAVPAAEKPESKASSQKVHSAQSLPVDVSVT
eukprot:COSAG01_NODE_2773_length_7101_cov_5.678806_8_plen_101_part_00